MEFFHDHRPVGTFHRSYKDGEEVFDWTQYLTTLCVKPGAAPHTRFFQEMPQQWREYLSHTQGKERKSALQLLKEIVEDGNVALCDEALELATSNGRTDADSLRQFYYLIARRENRPDPLRLSSGPAINYNPSLTVYDRLTGGVANAGVN